MIMIQLLMNACIPVYSNCNLDFRWKEIQFTSWCLNYSILFGVYHNYLHYRVYTQHSLNTNQITFTFNYLLLTKLLEFHWNSEYSLRYVFTIIPKCDLLKESDHESLSSWRILPYYFYSFYLHTSGFSKTLI